jgi:ring hydroxylating enzyme alpha subunit
MARCESRPSWTRATGCPKGQLSLHPVGVATWGGFVFVNLSPAEEPGGLVAQLDGADVRTERYPLAELRTARRITYDVRANWKCILENYNECYHCGPVHPELCEYSHGIVALDLAPLAAGTPGDPVAVGQFVPEGVPAPTPFLHDGVAVVWGVFVRTGDDLVFASDMAGGLWIVRPTGDAVP